MSAELQREIETLRAQLAEAEQMRNAIVRAEIDGFVVGDGDGDRYVHLLAGAYARDIAERQRRHQASDERTRRFLSILAVELLLMLKGMRQSLEALKREGPKGDAKALEQLEAQVGAMQRVAEDLRTINPQDG